jgi:hypothetical protein
MTLLRTDIERNDRLSEDRRTGDMVWLPGGTFRMGSDDDYPEGAPVHRVTVDRFWIDRTLVTNRQFKQFVKATVSDFFMADAGVTNAKPATEYFDPSLYLATIQ